MIYNSVPDIVDFVNDYYKEHGILTDDKEILEFVKELQKQIANMSFEIPQGATVIGYSGNSNGQGAYKIVEMTSNKLGDKVIYISDLPAGNVLDDEYFIKAINKIFAGDDEIISKVLNGKYNGKRLFNGSCGYGDLLSLDDFVSAKLMGEVVGTSDNLIIFAPEEIVPEKVLATTEIEKAFSNDTFEYINGIPKEDLKAIYESGSEGRETVFQILSRTGREIVGNTGDIEPQADKLMEAMSEGGIVSKNDCDFTVRTWYATNGDLIGNELHSKRRNEALKSDYADGNHLIDSKNTQFLAGYMKPSVYYNTFRTVSSNGIYKSSEIHELKNDPTRARNNPVSLDSYYEKYKNVKQKFNSNKQENKTEMIKQNDINNNGSNSAMKNSQTMNLPKSPKL